MPTTFIAVQCFQCSTMQVKQQKKSNNKWTCVVCNEKQSVQKVFAKGFMAKDVRKFVQNFNMSRQLAEQKHEAKLFEQVEEIGNQFTSNEGKKEKRTDWSEYVDYEEEEEEEEEEDELIEGDGFEPLIVTEMPKALFKKPKLSNHSAGGSDFEDGEKLLKPVFTKRQSTCSQESVGLQETTNRGSTKLDPSDRASKWSCFKVNIQEGGFNLASRATLLHKPTKDTKCSFSNITRDADENFALRFKGPVSKWSNYITEDDDVLIGEGNHEFENLLNDQRVEEDVHPDFL